MASARMVTLLFLLSILAIGVMPAPQLTAPRPVRINCVLCGGDCPTNQVYDANLRRCVTTVIWK